MNLSSQQSADVAAGGIRTPVVPVAAASYIIRGLTILHFLDT